jgi:cytochrome c oxidase subunit 2
MTGKRWAGRLIPSAVRSTRASALIAVALAAAALSLPTSPLSASAANQTSEPRRIEITASRFSYSPSEITLKKGEPVVLILTSTDVTHGLALKDLGVRTEIKKGKTTAAEITPMKVGTFQGKCSHFCGKGHGSMILTVNVVE